MVNYLLDLLRIMLAGLPIYIFLRILYLRWKYKKIAANTMSTVQPGKLFPREIYMGIFVLFMAALFTFVGQGTYTSFPRMLILAQERIHNGIGINLVPFRTISNYYRYFHFYGDLFIVNIAGNVLLFIPWGFGLLFLWKRNRKIYRLVFFAIMLPVGIELFQLFIDRQVDIDDVILNFEGALLGGTIYWFLVKIFPILKEYGE